VAITSGNHRPVSSSENSSEPNSRISKNILLIQSFEQP
jgi:hypothetical protein